MLRTKLSFFLALLLLLFLLGRPTRGVSLHRMSIAPNVSTTKPHHWFGGGSSRGGGGTLNLPMWYQQQQSNPQYNHHYYSRNYKVFHLKFLSQTDVRCNDGTRTGYYIRRARDTNSRNWMIYLEGGWYCFDEATCISRQITNQALFSSRTWHMNRYIGGVLSWDERVNPNFHNYNIIYVPYCSSDLWTGKKKEKTGGYYFHGSRILTAVVDDLLRRPEFANSDKVVFAGSRLRRGLRIRNQRRPLSSGRNQQLHRSTARPVQVSGLVDSAWFLNHPAYPQPYSGSCTSIYDCPPEEGILRGIGLWQPRIPRRCRREQGVKNFWQCYLGPTIYPHIRTPTFIIQSLFDEAQLQMSRANLLAGGPYTKLTYIQNLGKFVSKSLRMVHGVFAPACTDHEILTTNHWSHLMVDSQNLHDTLSAWDAYLTRWRGFPNWLFHLRSRQEVGALADDTDYPSRAPKLNSSMIFLSKLVAVLNRPKTGSSAMRGDRRPRHLPTPASFPYRAIDACSLDARPGDSGGGRGVAGSRSCSARSHLTPLCNPTCRALLHPQTMERLSVVSLYELYGVDSSQLAISIGYSVTQLKALSGQEQIRAIFCRPG